LNFPPKAEGLGYLEQVERGIRRCLDFITGGDGDPGSVRDQLPHLKARKREIAADLKAQRCDPEIEIHPNLPDLYGRGSGFDVVTVLRRA